MRDEARTPSSSAAASSAAAPTPGSGLTISHVTKRFAGDVTAVDDVSIDVPSGAFLVLLGPSGCGKTTLLRMVSGLETPTAGRIDIADRTVFDGDARVDVPPGKRGVGLVFQSYALWPHMTVAGNVTWPLKVARLPKPERAARLTETLELLGIDHLADRYPGQLSGGQQQRVAIARTIAARPALLLLDEPLSNLDAALRHEMRGELARLHRLHGATAVHVTHDQLEALTLATHIAVLQGGRVVQLGTPRELLEAPASPFVAGFVGSPPYVVVPAELARRAGCGVGANAASVAVRPERIVLGPPSGPLSGTLLETSPLADRWYTTILVDGRRLAVLGASPPDASPGDAVSVAFPADPDVEFAAGD